MDAPLSPHTAELLTRLRELDRADDALELRLAVVRQQLKAAEAQAQADPTAALHRVEHARERLRQAG